MVSLIFKAAAATVATLSLATAASASCGNSLYCGQSTASYAPTTNYTTTMSSYQADATYGTGSISETYTANDTYNFSGSTTSVAGLGHNERLQATNCPVNVHGAGEGKVIGCYNVVKPVPQTTYYRVVRPVIYVRYPVPVAVPYTSPCHTVTHHSRYGDFGQVRNQFRGGCRR